MRVVVQRCLSSSVIVDNQVVAKISKGLNLLVCVEKDDTKDSIKKAVTKVANLRIFTDPESGKMSLNTAQVNGSFLAISQFTLSWRGERGNRPSFDRSMEPKVAQDYFEIFCEQLKEYAPVEKGIFAADMQVQIKNDGPVTFILDF